MKKKCYEFSLHVTQSNRVNSILVATESDTESGFNSSRPEYSVYWRLRVESSGAGFERWMASSQNFHRLEYILPCDVTETHFLDNSKDPARLLEYVYCFGPNYYPVQNHRPDLHEYFIIQIIVNMQII